MEIIVVPAYDREDELRELFGEYTALLVEGDPKFASYLAIQKYDDELTHPGAKYALPCGRLYLALCDGECAGCIALRRIDGNRCELKRLYVRPEFRGKGIGRLLVNRVISDARAIGYRSILLDTLPFLHTAIDMYKSMGFYEIARYNDNPLIDSVYLQLDLPVKDGGAPNPWEQIKLEDYEGHMSLESVRQLQALNGIMHAQFTQYPVKSAMLLGAAGGNGLEHAYGSKYDRVYAVDINRDYLAACEKKHGAALGERLECLRTDLTADIGALPHAELVIANLLIEYIGCSCFAEVIKQVKPSCISCAIQADCGEGFVSHSPYAHAFDALGDIHSEIDADELTAALRGIGYELSGRSVTSLPNGKALHRLDYMRPTL